MSRIRSIHPGLFTDEAFMSASIPARVLIIGLWTEAWDDGVFEWKPLTLKARIFPVDNVNVEDLLGELMDLGFVGPFHANDKKYGAIRNFQKWQRPKKPNSSGVLPDDLASYVGQSVTSSEPVPNQSETGPEKSPQMEDGGGRKEEKKEPLSEVPSDFAAETKPKKPKADYPADFQAFWSDYPTDPIMSKKDAYAAWKRLDEADRALAMLGIPAIKEHQRKNPTYRMVHACRYLSQRRFEGLASAAPSTPAAQVVPQFQTEEEHQAWWEERCRKAAAAGAA